MSFEVFVGAQLNSDRVRVILFNTIPFVYLIP